MERVVIVSASVGAGHDGAAWELARRLRARGFHVTCHDFVDMLPIGIGRMLRAGYRRQLQFAPRSWEWLLEVLQRSRPLAGFVLWLSGLATRGMTRALGSDPDLVVSTYPLASQVLAQLKRRGRLAAPVATFLTDVSVHRLWVAADTDLYLAVHAVAAEQARQLGARNVCVTAPAVGSEFRPAADTAEQEAARAEFGLPPDARLALVLSGSWGVGDVEQSAGDIAASGAAIPVVVCGHNTELRERLHTLQPAVVLGWVDDMPTLLRACDVVVHNAGGLSTLEAFAADVPVVMYRCLAGHGRINAQAWEAAGLAPWVRTPSQLAPTLNTILAQRVAAGSNGAPVVEHAAGTVTDMKAAPDPGAVLTALAGQPSAVAQHSPPVRTLWRRRLSLTVAAAALLWLSTEGTSLAVEHGYSAVRPAATSDATYTVVELPADRPLAPDELRTMVDMHAAVAVSLAAAQQQPDSVRSAARAGLVIINAANGAPYQTGVIRGRTVIGAAAHAIRPLAGGSPSLVLSNGDVDAVDIGMVSWYRERFLVPHATVGCGAPIPSLRPGGVVLIEAPPAQRCGLAPLLTRFAQQAAAQSLHPTSLEPSRHH